MKTLSKYVSVSLIAVGLLASASVTFAQERGYNMPAFESFDLNKDGYLTESEMDEARAKRIEKKVEENRRLRNVGGQSSFADIDANGDKKVSKEEFTSHQMKQRQSN